ncbi:MAG: hypothetical protein OEY19_13310 [Gammaproteobacteria bacterium]|nr:hypothetical protein [Gammaproteobacteria bacterium]
MISTILCFLSACSASYRQVDEYAGSSNAKPARELKLLPEVHFGDPIDIIEPKQIFALSEKQKQEFLNFANHGKFKSEATNKIIYNYLKDKLSSFNFYSSTYTASKALALNEGNCLSLAIVTKSLADLLRVEIHYQLVNTPPVYQRKDNLVVSSQHIRTKLIETPNSHNQITVFASNILIDYFPVKGTRMLRRVPEQEFISMYYQNMAAESILGGKLKPAYWYLVKSLELTKDNPITLNMLALIHERMGYDDYAEGIYLYGLENTHEKLNLLNNYHILLVHQNRHQEARKIATQLEQYQDNNPFKWINIADTAYNLKDYEKAILLYNKAKKMAPYLHEPYAGIARAKIQLGEYQDAQRHLESALENTYSDDFKNVYLSKYKLLTKLINDN